MLKVKRLLMLLFGLSGSVTFIQANMPDTQLIRESQVITRAEQIKVNLAPEKNFNGEAHFSRFPIMPSEGNVAPAIVHFSANVRTNWHIHHHGQYLIVIEGEGQIQEWGKPIEVLQKGDVVWCPPGIKHWHGASPDSTMTHIAISPVSTSSPSVTWLERVDLTVQ